MLVSVIVPIYNVDCYLKECLDSILKQKYKNLEILLIDDGSTDLSGKICDEYKKKDKRITVIHQENRGLSGARNTGLDISKGDYICFIDSDDIVKPNFLSELLNLSIKNKSDISCCSAFDLSNENHLILSLDDGVYPNINYLKKYTRVVCWNKLYKKHVFNKIRFPKKLSEDSYVLFDVTMKSKIVATTSTALYGYRTNNNHSISNMKSWQYFVDAMESRFINLNKIIKYYYDYELFNVWFLDFYNWYKICLQNKQKIKDKFKIIKVYFLRVRKFKKYLSLKNKIRAFFPKICVLFNK